MATLLLVCFGFLIPTAASPIRVCFLDQEVLEPGFKTFGETPDHKEKCCPDCGKDGENCCMDVQRLPDALEASWPQTLPPALFFELPSPILTPVCQVVEIPAVFAAEAPIRGPDTPGLRRALLEIWNI